IVLSHNHPSGYAEPGNADRLITDHLQQALKLVDICLLDHLVVGGMDIVSVAERGWILGESNDENHQQRSGNGDIHPA
ncbi:JAB domain-containing protein, partial [Klebsiella variicola]|uniref:JAB domain-containing protein n=1 Tax=Klebsiella variicola TaxID=244366 RepID=UPI003F6C292F